MIRSDTSGLFQQKELCGKHKGQSWGVPRGRLLERRQKKAVGGPEKAPGPTAQALKGVSPDLSVSGLVLCPHSPCQMHTWSRPVGGPSWSCKSRGCQGGCTTAACRGRRSGTGREHQQLPRRLPRWGPSRDAFLSPRVLLDSCEAGAVGLPMTGLCGQWVP